MGYQVIISRSAEKDISRLPQVVLKRVATAIDGLMSNPFPQGAKKMTSTEKNLWRVRIGDYRMVYQVDTAISVVDIRRVRHRKDVYKL